MWRLVNLHSVLNSVKIITTDQNSQAFSLELPKLLLLDTNKLTRKNLTGKIKKSLESTQVPKHQIEELKVIFTNLGKTFTKLSEEISQSNLPNPNQNSSEPRLSPVSTRDSEAQSGSPKPPRQSSKALIKDLKHVVEELKDAAPSITQKLNAIIADKEARLEDAKEKRQLNLEAKRRREECQIVKKIKVITHPMVESGQKCDNCPKGRMYKTDPSTSIKREVQIIVRIIQQERERYRCNCCGHYSVAPDPEPSNPTGFTRQSLLCLTQLIANGNLPFYRCANLLNNWGLNVDARDIQKGVAWMATFLRPIYASMQSEVVNCPIIQADDTTVKCLSIIAKSKQQGPKKKRKGKNLPHEERLTVYKTALIGLDLNHKIVAVTYQTSGKHMSEKLVTLLTKRDPASKEYILMADMAAVCESALKNTDKSGKTSYYRAGCNAHALRRFKEACKYDPRFEELLKLYQEIYEIDCLIREANLDPQERLSLHQQMSKLRFEKMTTVCQNLLNHPDAKQRVEPNSKPGEALRYFLNHQKALSAFLDYVGAPLDNNLAERVLKKPIIHRKNSYFYKNFKGAEDLDILYSIAQTCALLGVNFAQYLDYLHKLGAAELQEHSQFHTPTAYYTRKNAQKSSAA